VQLEEKGVEKMSIKQTTFGSLRRC